MIAVYSKRRIILTFYLACLMAYLEWPSIKLNQELSVISHGATKAFRKVKIQNIHH